MCSFWKMDSIRQMDCLCRNCDAFQLIGAWGRLLPVGRERNPSDHLKAYLELWQSDDDQHGKDEVEVLIRENAAIIQRHPEILLGDLSVFPENEPAGEVKTTTTIQIRRLDRRMEKYLDGYKVKKNGFAEWLKSLLKLKKR